MESDYLLLHIEKAVLPYSIFKINIDSSLASYD